MRYVPRPGTENVRGKALSDRSDSSTDLSILKRMGDTRQRAEAWEVFMDRYARLFFHWFRDWGVNPDDMEDVLQDVVLRILKNLKFFDRRRHGSFRAWLKALGHSSWKQLMTEASRQLADRPADPKLVRNWTQIGSKAAETHIIQLFDAWATQELIELAQDNVRRRVSPETWQTYALVTYDQRPVEELRASFGISTEQIYNRIFRVRKMMREELNVLDV